jgi:phage protein D
MTTRTMAPDHRRAALAERAFRRIRRRALLLLTACEEGRPEPTPDQVALFDRLIGEADALWVRLAGLSGRDLELHEQWLVAA